MTLRYQAQALNIIITRVLPAPGSPPSTILNPLGQPISNPSAVTVTQTVPARRFDPPVRDEVQSGAGLYFGLNDARYIVRQDPVNPWSVNSSFTDEAGARRRVVGIRNAQQQAHVAGGLLELVGRTA